MSKQINYIDWVLRQNEFSSKIDEDSQRNDASLGLIVVPRIDFWS